MIIIYNEILSLKKRSGVATSECYFLQFSKIMKFQQNTKFTTISVHIVTRGSFEKFIYVYKISICEIYMFIVCTHFFQCIKRVISILGFGFT